MAQFKVPEAPKTYVQRYDRFGGVDFSTDPALIADTRSPIAKNLLSDSGGYPEKRHGWRVLYRFDAKIYGMHKAFLQGSMQILMHVGTSLYKWAEEPVCLYTNMNAGFSTSFVFDQKCYILDGASYLVYDGESVSKVQGFVPTTTISNGAYGTATVLEAPNYLTPMRKNSFYTKAEQKDYTLDATVDADTTPTIILNGQALTAFTLDDDRQTIHLTENPGDPPGGGGVDNMIVTFSHDNGANPVVKCNMHCWFGAGNNSRVFVAGNPDTPNIDYASGLYDPTYFPMDGYTQIGTDASEIMGYLLQYNTMLVVKSDNEQDATLYARTAELTTLTEESTAPDDPKVRTVATFPLKQGVAGVGAIAKRSFAILRDNPLFLSKDGVFMPTTYYGGVSEQRAMQNKSHLVDARLTQEPNLETACSVVWNGYYILCVNTHCYVADSRQRSGKGANESWGYEWFYWDNIPAILFMELDGELYFGTNDGRFCKFNTDVTNGSQFNDEAPDGGEVPIDAVWATKADDDGNFMLYKSIPRFGTGIMIKPFSKSSADVTIRTEVDMGTKIRLTTTDLFDFNDIDFQRFTFRTIDTPQVIPTNFMIRNYKTAQIIVRNNQLNEGFGVYGIVKRYTVGNYVR